MRAPRIRSQKSHWTAVGQATAAQGQKIDIVLTGNAAVDKWIADGFYRHAARIERAKKQEYDLVCSKVRESRKVNQF
jgi:hypothetical protein